MILILGQTNNRKELIGNTILLFYQEVNGADGGEVTVEKAAKPVTTVQEGVLTFVSMKPLDVL